MFEFIVDKDYEKQTVGRFLRTYCDISARTLAKLKRTQGGILLNGSFARAIDPVKAGDRITLNLPESSSEGVEAIEMPLDIVYEDEYIIVLNKPPFMPVHPTKVHQEDTLANGLKFYAESKGERYAFRAVNRIDRNTSGLVIVAKDRHTAFALSSADIKKNYTALCHGKIVEKGTVDAPIALSPTSKIVRTVSLSGKQAVTHYEPIKVYEDYTALNLWLQTGRTHQIRCHMSHIGHPLLGDDLYGGKPDKINRHALHCGFVSFTHPVTGEYLELTAHIPQDMKVLL